MQTIKLYGFDAYITRKPYTFYSDIERTSFFKKHSFIGQFQFFPSCFSCESIECL